MSSSRPFPALHAECRALPVRRQALLRRMRAGASLLLLSGVVAAPAAGQPASPSEQTLPGAPQMRQQPAQGPTRGNPSPQEGAPSEDTLPASPEQRQQPPAGPSDQAPAKGAGLLQRDRLLGDLGGLRTRLENKGITFGLQGQAEVLGNAPEASGREPFSRAPS